jgi:parallel beta helix pectate lyase-like protein
LRNNARDGIAINDNSSARIGFLDGQDAAARPNIIDGNSRGGVTVSRSSSARIAGNSFTGNADYAVRLVRGGQADVAGNTMNNNLGGILVRENSTAILADAGDGLGAFLTTPNSGVNTQNGVRCRQAGVVSGSIGTLTGLGGAVSAPTDNLCGIFVVP